MPSPTVDPVTGHKYLDMPDVVRLTLGTADGRRRTVWARVIKRNAPTKIGTANIYGRLTRSGSKWVGDGDAVEIIMAAPSEVIERGPVQLNLHYEELELVLDTHPPV
jgi:hypothetical protein